MKKTILIVEDDQKLNHLMRKYLSKHGFDILQAFSGDVGIQMIIEHRPNLVILDLMLPNISGIQVCQAIRKNYDGLILMLTAQDDDESEIKGLKLGANEYLKKPMNPEVLLLRIHNLLKAQQKNDIDKSKPLQFGALCLDRIKCEVTLDGVLIELSQSDFKLLAYLATHADQLLTRDQLYLAVKGVEYDGIDRSIDTKISNLRKQLGDNSNNPNKIKTIWGKGYVFCSDAWNLMDD